MLKSYSPLPLPSNDISEIFAIQRRIKQFKALQELPLILIPEDMLSIPLEIIGDQPRIQQAIQQSLQEARIDDERLRIERPFIPHIPIYIPDTPEGREFFKIAKAIANIPLYAPIPIKNENQGFWLKTLHYFWQARGVILAHQVIGLIRDPLKDGGVLSNGLPSKSLNHLKLNRDIDIACFQILTNGWKILQKRAEDQRIDYPFSQPLELFIEILKQEFLIAWNDGPGNPELKWVAKNIQRSNISTQIHICQEGIWKQPKSMNALDEKCKAEYLQYLSEVSSWNSYWILAMQGQMDKSGKYNHQLEPYLEAYCKAVEKGRELFVDEFDWQSGKPFKNRITRGKVTNGHRHVQGGINSLGYIIWYWT